jgi:hypothetical protein
MALRLMGKMPMLLAAFFDAVAGLALLVAGFHGALPVDDLATAFRHPAGTKSLASLLFAIAIAIILHDYLPYCVYDLLVTIYDCRPASDAK